MRHLRLVVQYDGTDFAGFQFQPDQRTVQGVLQEALSQLLGEKIQVCGASRTDAGVHACGQVVSFKTACAIPLERIVPALNALLPRDVAAMEVAEAPEHFHPRYQARRKYYVYRILNRPLPSPFWGRYAWHVPRPLDVEAMQQGARHLWGEHDFAAFCAAGGSAKTTVRTLYELTVERQGDMIEVKASGNGFLYMMMRIIVGTLVEVGLGKRPAEEMAAILASRDRRRAGPTAPPHGLTLQQIEY